MPGKTKSLRYALGLFNRASLDFVDCLPFACRKVEAADILSFDKKQSMTLEKDFPIYLCYNESNRIYGGTQ